MAEKAADVTKKGEDEAHTFTAADDAKLIEMKAAGKTWKEIVAETKKSQSALKDRFKEIAPKADTSGEAGGAKDEKIKEAEGTAAEDQKAEDNKAEDQKAEDKSQKGASTGKKGKKDRSESTEKVRKSSACNFST